jgi:hypothetical protein
MRPDPSAKTDLEELELFNPFLTYRNHLRSDLEMRADFSGLFGNIFRLILRYLSTPTIHANDSQPLDIFDANQLLRVDNLTVVAFWDPSVSLYLPLLLAACGLGSLSTFVYQRRLANFTVYPIKKLEEFLRQAPNLTSILLNDYDIPSSNFAKTNSERLKLRDITI